MGCEQQAQSGREEETNLDKNLALSHELHHLSNIRSRLVKQLQLLPELAN